MNVPMPAASASSASLAMSSVGMPEHPAMVIEAENPDLIGSVSAGGPTRCGMEV
jgi:hypothetical protein